MNSSDKASDVFSSDLLFEVAPLAGSFIMDCCRKNSSSSGSRIGTGLFVINRHLQGVQPFQLSEMVQDLSRRALQDCLKICKWPATSAATKAQDHGYFSNSLLPPTAGSIYNELRGLLLSSPNVIHEGINNFLAAKTDVNFYASRFQELIDLLDPDNRKLDGAGQSSLHARHLRPKEEYVYPDDVRDKLITALKRHAMCVSEVHMSAAPVGMSDRHLTRLCLSTEGRNEKQLVQFDLAMALMDFMFWQDFLLDVTLPTTSSAPKVAAASSDETDGQIAIMKVGDVCRILERKRGTHSSQELRFKLDHNCHLHKHKLARALPYAKPCGMGFSLADLLDQGRYYLTPNDRIVLSFAVARSFWEFYGSELTAARWSSEDIWFMPRRKKNHQSSDIMELRAFFNVPFGQDPLGPDEFLEVDDLTHTYPRILSLGIILLEIGRGKKLDLAPLTATENHEDLRDSVNDAHSEATSELAALKDEVWDTCKYKVALDTAISNCLDHGKFIERPETRKRRSRLTRKEYDELSPKWRAVEDHKRMEYQKRVMKERREAIYYHVVSRLYWLAKVGIGAGKDAFPITVREKQPASVRRQCTTSDNDTAEIQELWGRVQTPSFDSDRPAKGSAEMWFEDIRNISSMVFVRRRLLHVNKGVHLAPVRIAILDTGCHSDLQSFRNANCFKGWRDFTAGPPSEISVDEEGHGTFMARLMVQMVPGCELYIARVAQTTKQLEGNEQGVANAIKYAGEEWKVDIISMSFGFSKFSQPISDAIRDVRNMRRDGIIFLASAGNGVDRAEAFPACDPAVIAMYATESSGAFLKTNPFPSKESRHSLGTYGDNIPDAVLAELRAQFGEGVFGGGTSVATAVAAGIAGLMLAYVALIPHVLPGCGAEEVYSDLKMTDGMRHMLFGMANTWNKRQYFINPIRFWSHNPKADSSVYRKICRAVPQKEFAR